MNISENGVTFVCNFLLLKSQAIDRVLIPPVGAPTISVVNNGDGTVTVTFEGKLQGAPTVNGPWAEVEGAVSPQIIPASEAMQFGRAVK